MSDMLIIKDVKRFIDAVENIDGGCHTCIERFLGGIEPELANSIAPKLLVYGEKLTQSESGRWEAQ